MAGDLADKVAIVTGSSRGIGKAIALAYAREGARVVVTGRTSATADREGIGSVEQTVQEIEAAGGTALGLTCDVASSEDVKRMVAAVTERFGRIDVLVNNAGLLRWNGVLGASEEEWRAILGTNLDGVYYSTMAVLPGMMERGRGVILNITSSRATSTDANATAYSVSKAALDRLTVKLAAEVREHGIAVNALQPGLTLTHGVAQSAPDRDMSDVPGPEDDRKKIIASAVWLAAHAGEPDRFYSGNVVSEADFGTSWP